VAWQPFTPRGAAAFAGAPLNRVCLFQALLAFLSALVVVWFLRTAIFPVVRDAIERLPDSGALSVGELRLPVPSLPHTAERGWFAIDLDLDQLVRSSDGHDLELRFTRSGAQICTVFGCGFVPYRPEWKMPFNRSELRPWWDAWQPVLFGIAGFATLLLLPVVWWGLACLYCFVPRISAFFGDRALTLAGAWRIAAASLLPGATILCGGLVALGTGWIDPLRFLLVFVIHLVLPISYLVVAPLYVPIRTRVAPAAANPFDGVAPVVPTVAPVLATPVVPPAPAPAPQADASPGPVRRAENPFAEERAAPTQAERNKGSKNPFAAT
jgi:hypothetical protein